MKIAALRRLLYLLGQHRLAAVLRNYGHADTAHYWDLVEAQLAYRRRFCAALDGDRGGPFEVIICHRSRMTGGVARAAPMRIPLFHVQQSRIPTLPTRGRLSCSGHTIQPAGMTWPVTRPLSRGATAPRAIQ